MYRSLLAAAFCFSPFVFATPQVDAGQLSGLPACAQGAAQAALGSTGCALTDTACICGSKAFINALTTTIVQSCSTADVDAAIAFGQSICGSSLASTPDSSTSSEPTSAPATPVTGGADTSGVFATNGGPTDAAGAATTTTVVGTLTSMTSLPVSDSTMLPASLSLVNGTMTSMCTTTTMMMTFGNTGNSATYTGAAVAGNVRVKGLAAVLMGVAGAHALL